MDEETQAQSNQEGSPVEIDQAKLQSFMREAKANQSLALGVLAGIVAAFLGAIVWAVVTGITGYQIGWMAVGVGFLVGFSVRQFGKGIDTSFGVAGAVLSLFGCLAGNLLAVCVVVARHEEIPILDLLNRLDPAIAVELMKATFSPMDLLFYGIAVYEGYKFSFRRISGDEVARVTSPTP